MQCDVPNFTRRQDIAVFVDDFDDVSRRRFTHGTQDAIRRLSDAQQQRVFRLAVAVTTSMLNIF